MFKTILLKFILIASLLFSFNGEAKGQKIIAGPEIPVEDIVLTYRAAKNFLRDSSVTIILKDNLLHPNIEGITQQIHKSLYCIDISTQVQSPVLRKWVILHEMGHVLDLHEGRLSQTPPRWMGEKMNPDLPWDVRPWEQAADEWAFIMWGILVDDTVPPFIILKIVK